MGYEDVEVSIHLSVEHVKALSAFVKGLGYCEEGYVTTLGLCN